MHIQIGQIYEYNLQADARALIDLVESFDVLGIHDVA